MPVVLKADQLLKIEIRESFEADIVTVPKTASMVK